MHCSGKCPMNSFSSSPPLDPRWDIDHDLYVTAAFRADTLEQPCYTDKRRPKRASLPSLEQGSRIAEPPCFSCMPLMGLHSSLEMGGP